MDDVVPVVAWRGLGYERAFVLLASNHFELAQEKGKLKNTQHSTSFYVPGSTSSTSVQ
jgi:hypothetical protein